MVRGGQMRLNQRIIIERPDWATTTLNSRVTSFTIAPEWNVPRSVTVHHILLHLKANARCVPKQEQDFLANDNYRLFDAKGRPVNLTATNWQTITAQKFPHTIRQAAVCGNLLNNTF